MDKRAVTILIIIFILITTILSIFLIFLPRIQAPKTVSAVITGKFEVERKTGWGMVGNTVLDSYDCSEFWSGNPGKSKGCLYVGKEVKVSGYITEHQCRENEQCLSGVKFMKVKKIEILGDNQAVDNDLNCSFDSDCTITTFPLVKCCHGCQPYPINIKTQTIEQSWRDKNCADSICPMIKCPGFKVQPACNGNKCILQDLNKVKVETDKDEYSLGEKIKAQAVFDGEVYVWPVGIWTVLKLENGIWNTLARSRECPNPPKCNEMGANCGVGIMCEAPIWYKVPSNHVYTGYVWDGKVEIGETTFLCSNGLLIDCLNTKLANSGTYIIRFEYANNKNNDEFQKGQVPTTYAQKQISINEKNENVALIGNYQSVTGIKDPLSCYCFKAGYLIDESGARTSVCIEDDQLPDIICTRVAVDGYFEDKTISPGTNDQCSPGTMSLFIATSFSCKVEKNISNKSKSDVIYSDKDKNLPKEYEEIDAAFTNYINAEKQCDIQGAKSLITQNSQTIMNFSCSNMKSESVCYDGKAYLKIVKNNDALIYFTPFNHQTGWPIFFKKENNSWKIDFIFMAENIAMGGGGCNTGWGWRTDEAKNKFCNFFHAGNCPETQ